MADSGRENFRKRVEEISPELFQSLYDIANGATKEHIHVVKCKCGFNHREVFRVEDQSARLKAIDMLAQHGWGRPAQVEQEKNASWQGKTAEEMSSEERAELIALARKQLKGDNDGKTDGSTAQEAS